MNIEQSPVLPTIQADVQLGGDPQIDGADPLLTDGYKITDTALTDVIRSERWNKFEVVSTGTATGNRLTFARDVRSLMAAPGRSAFLARYGMIKFDFLDVMFDFSAPPQAHGIFKLVFVPGILKSNEILERANQLNGIDVILGETDTSPILRVPMSHFRKYWSDVNMNSSNRGGGTVYPFEMGAVCLVQYSQTKISGTATSVDFTINTRLAGFEGHFSMAQAQGNENIYYYPSMSVFNTVSDVLSLTPSHTNGVPLGTVDMSVNDIEKHMFYEQTFTWAASAVVGSKLYSRQLKPGLRTLDPNVVFDPRSVSNFHELMSFMSAYFSGNLRFKFLASKPFGIQGKLKVVLEFSLDSTNDTPKEQCPFMIFDIGTNSIIQVEMGPPRDTPLKRCEDATFAGNANAMNAYIAIYVESKLISVAPVIDIEMHSFIGGATDGPGQLKWYLPRSFPYSAVPVRQSLPGARNELFNYIGCSETPVMEMPSGMSQIVSIAQLLETKDCKLFRSAADDVTFPRIPVTPNLIVSEGEGRNNKLPIFGDLFAFWKGSLEVFVNSNVNVTKVECLPLTDYLPAMPTGSKHNGVMSGMQQVVNTTSFQGLAVRDNCPNQRNVCNSWIDWTLASDNADRVPRFIKTINANQMLSITCYDSITSTAGHFVEMYVGAGMDFEFMEYRGVSTVVGNYIEDTYGWDGSRGAFGTDLFPVNWTLRDDPGLVEPVAQARSVLSSLLCGSGRVSNDFQRLTLDESSNLEDKYREAQRTARPQGPKIMRRRPESEESQKIQTSFSGLVDAEIPVYNFVDMALDICPKFVDILNKVDGLYEDDCHFGNSPLSILARICHNSLSQEVYHEIVKRMTGVYCGRILLGEFIVAFNDKRAKKVPTRAILGELVEDHLIVVSILDSDIKTHLKDFPFHMKLTPYKYVTPVSAKIPEFGSYATKPSMNGSNGISIKTTCECDINDNLAFDYVFIRPDCPHGYGGAYYDDASIAYEEGQFPLMCTRKQLQVGSLNAGFDLDGFVEHDPYLPEMVEVDRYHLKGYKFTNIVNYGVGTRCRMPLP